MGGRGWVGGGVGEEGGYGWGGGWGGRVWVDGGEGGGRCIIELNHLGVLAPTSTCTGELQTSKMDRGGIKRVF